MTHSIDQDVVLLRECLATVPVQWEGRDAILELRERDYNWRQMEWIGFYFETLCRDRMHDIFAIPGRIYGNVTFDSFRSINWDMKTSAIRTDRHSAILNDISATDSSIAECGGHGIIMALVDVEYNDEERTFQQWHTELKGGLSVYEEERIRRNATSRYRKTSAILRQVLFLLLTEQNKNELSLHAQGRNSNGLPRNPKYVINIEQAANFEIGRIDFIA